MNGFPSVSEIKRYKLQFPVGSRVMCDYCSDPYNPISTGAIGTIINVDDIGTVHIDWDSGRTLGLVPGEDSFHIIKE